MATNNRQAHLQQRLRRALVFWAAVASIVPMVSSARAPQPVPATNLELVLQVGHAGAVNAIALSPDGRFLVSGGNDGAIKIWDVATGHVLRTWYGHENAVYGVAVASDGRLVASGGQDGRVRIWDVMTGDLRILGAHRQSVKELAFSPDGRRLTSLGISDLKVWDLATSRELRSTALIDEKDMIATITADRSATALTADGRLAAVTNGYQRLGGVAERLRVIEAATGRELGSIRIQGQLPMPAGLRFSPDGRLLVAKVVENLALQNRGAAPALDSLMRSTLIVYDVASAREIKRLPSADRLSQGGIEFSPDGKLFASRGTNLRMGTAMTGSVLLFDVATWRQVRELTGTYAQGPDLSRQSLSVTPLTFSGDGKLLAMSFGEGVAIFDAASGSRVRVMRTTKAVTALSDSPRSAAADQTLRDAGRDPEAGRDSWRNAATVSTREIGLGPKDAINSRIAFSLDGKQLSATNTTTVWDTVAGAPRARSPFETLQRLDMAARHIPEPAFSADGKLRAQIGNYAAAMAAAVATGRAPTPEELMANSVIIAETDSGKVLQTIPLVKGNPSNGLGVEVDVLAFNSRGLVVQFCDSTARECHLKTFDPSTGRELRDFKPGKTESQALIGEPAARALVSHGGRFLVTFDMGRPKVSGGKSKFGIGRSLSMTTPDSVTQPYTMKVTDVDTGRKMWEIKGVTDGMYTAPKLTFGPDDAVVAVMTRERETSVLNLCDTSSGRILRSIDVGDHKVGGMTFSRDSTRLAVAYRNLGAEPTYGMRQPQRFENVVTVHDLTTGRQVFALAHETSVSGVAFSPDGRLIATTADDHNQYLWNAETGEKLATLVNLDVLGVANFSEWLVVTPDGLFDGSPGAWQQIMWRFSQNTFDVGPVEIFFNDLYSPGLAAEIFAGRRPKAPRTLQQIDRRQPVLSLNVPAAESAARTVTVRIDIAEAGPDATHAAGSGVKDVRLFRNGTLVKLWRGDVLNGRPRATIEASVPIVAGENHLTAYAFNRENVKSVDASTTVVGSSTLKRKGTAYVLAVGVNQYENAEYNLKFAGADATAFAAELKAQQLKLDRFDRVEVVELLDQNATKANLLLALRRLAGTAPSLPAAPAVLSKLSQAQPEDAVLIYFAGHGTARDARFYLVPHDLGYSGPRARLDAQSVETILSHSVSDIELESAVEGLDAGELVLVIDACNSGQALEAEEKRRGPMNSKGLAQLAYEKGMYILTAAQSYQAALETSQLGHGYLTFALVEEGLKKGLADRGQKDGLVSVHEWFDYATERVPELQQNSNEGRLLLTMDQKLTDQNPIRNLQSPRAFYGRETDPFPVIIGQRD